MTTQKNATLFGLALAAAMSVFTFIVAFVAARATLIYLTRSWLETDRMLAEISASIEELTNDFVTKPRKGLLARLLTAFIRLVRQV